MKGKISWGSPCWAGAYLEALPDELGHLAVLRILLSSHDEVHEAGGVPSPHTAFIQPIFNVFKIVTVPFQMKGQE